MIPTLHIVCSLTASLPSVAASYAIPVRQASVLLTASFRFYLTVDTLAVQLHVPLVGPVEDFRLQVTQAGYHEPE